jgi:hypothetical protein
MNSEFAPLSSPDPFALLINPAAVLAVHERCSNRDGVPRRVHRPLDKPAGPANSREQAEFDRAIDLGRAPRALG